MSEACPFCGTRWSSGVGRVTIVLTRYSDTSDLFVYLDVCVGCSVDTVLEVRTASYSVPHGTVATFHGEMELSDYVDK